MFTRIKFEKRQDTKYDNTTKGLSTVTSRENEARTWCGSWFLLTSKLPNRISVLQDPVLIALVLNTFPARFQNVD